MRIDARGVAVSATTMALINLCVMLGIGMIATAPLGPQAFPIGIAAAVVSAGVGGVLVSLLAPQRATITAPSSSLAIIYAAAAAHLAAQGGAAGVPLIQLWAMLSLMVVVTGMLLVVMGTLRLSDAVSYMPLPVNIGFVSGIGLLVIASQLPSLLGGRPGGTVAHMLEAMHQFKPGAVAVGAVAAWLTFRAPSSRIASYGPLAAIVAGASLHHVLVWTSGHEVMGPTLGGVEIISSVRWTWQAIPLLGSGDWLGEALVDVLPFAFLLAFQAAMITSFTSAAMASPGGKRKSIYQILQAQGVANIACGCLGALPVSTNSPLSLMAARHGPGPRLPVACGVLVVAAAIAASALLGLLPLAAFAGVLIVSGARMIDPRIWQLLQSLYAVRRRVDTAMNLLVIGTVASLLMTQRVVAGIVAGILLELAHLALRAVYLQRSGAFGPMEAQDTATHDAGLRESGIEILRVDGLLFFGNVQNLAKRLARLPASTRHLVLDLSCVTHVDITAVHTLDRELEGLSANGVQTRFSGVRSGKGPLGHLTGAGPLMAGRPCYANLEGAVESIWPVARQPRDTELAA